MYNVCTCMCTLHMYIVHVATDFLPGNVQWYSIMYVLVLKYLCFGPELLVVVPVSQSSAQQRAGRAGRLRSGKVFRLYTGVLWTLSLKSATAIMSLYPSSLWYETQGHCKGWGNDLALSACYAREFSLSSQCGLGVRPIFYSATL